MMYRVSHILLIALIVCGCEEEVEIPPPSSQNKEVLVKPLPINTALKNGPTAEEVLQSLNIKTDDGTVVNKEGCRERSECAIEGRCASLSQPQGKKKEDDKVRCIALNRGQCLQSKNCQIHGQCTPAMGECVVSSDLDCQQSDRCPRYGVCRAHEGECIIAREEDCEASLVCLNLGTCSLMNNECVTDENLQSHCGAHCLYVEKNCLCAPQEFTFSPKFIEHPVCSSECQKDGKCALGTEGCEIRNQKMCERSEGCKRFGRCRYEDKACHVDESGCARSLECDLLGRCSFHKGRCVTTSPQECKQSLACKQLSRCNFELDETKDSVSPKPNSEKSAQAGAPQKLPPPPEESLDQVGRCSQPDHIAECDQQCALTGRCTPKGDRCVAVESAQCEQAEACKKYGRCTMINGGCVARSDKDCQRGVNCTLFGYCIAKRGRCTLP